MKRCATLTLVLAMIFTAAAPASAQVGFLFGLAIGSALSGDGNGIEQPNATIVYTNGDAMKRVKNPMSVKFAATDRLDFSSINLSAKNSSLYTLFLKVEPKAADHEVLQVLRVLRPDMPEVAVLWFAYIPKSDLVPLPR